MSLHNDICVASVISPHEKGCIPNKTDLSDLADVGAIAPQNSPNLSPHNSELDSAGAVRLNDCRAYPRDTLAIAWPGGLGHFVGGLVGAVGRHACLVGWAALWCEPTVITPCVLVKVESGLLLKHGFSTLMQATQHAAQLMHA